MPAKLRPMGHFANEGMSAGWGLVLGAGRTTLVQQRETQAWSPSSPLEETRKAFAFSVKATRIVKETRRISPRKQLPLLQLVLVLQEQTCRLPQPLLAMLLHVSLRQLPLHRSDPNQPRLRSGRRDWSPCAARAT